MEQILGKNCNQIFSGAPYRVQKDQGHLVTSVFWPQGHRTRYKIIRGTLDPDHPSKFGQWLWDTEHWVRCRWSPPQKNIKQFLCHRSYWLSKRNLKFTNTFSLFLSCVKYLMLFDVFNSSPQFYSHPACRTAIDLL